VVTCRGCGSHNLASMKFCCGCTRSLAETVAEAARRAAAAGPVLGEGAALDWRVGNPASWDVTQRQLRAHAAADAAAVGFRARMWRTLQGYRERLQSTSCGESGAGIAAGSDRRR
jgi:hypothetical protein